MVKRGLRLELVNKIHVGIVFHALSGRVLVNNAGDEDGRARLAREADLGVGAVEVG